MTNPLGNVSATVKGEQVEDHNDVGQRAVASLLDSLTFDDEDVEVVVHEVHDEDELNALTDRYSREWDARVEEDY